MKKILIILISVILFQNNLLAQNFSKFNQWLLENGHTQYLKEGGKFDICSFYKKTGKKPIIFLDNVRFLMGNFNEKEGQDWIDFVLWLATLRAKGYSTYFLHHAVNTGEKASGSGYQDSNLDVNIKLSQPDENSATDHSSDHFTQIQFEFKKMRENVIGQMTPFIMVVDRNKGSWSKFPVLNKTERKIKSMLDSGKSAKDIINPEKEGMSKANVHKTINKLKGENDGVDKKTSNREAKEVC